jgi:hypothetical protein
MLPMAKRVLAGSTLVIFIPVFGGDFGWIKIGMANAAPKPTAIAKVRIAAAHFTWLKPELRFSWVTCFRLSSFSISGKWVGSSPCFTILIIPPCHLSTNKKLLTLQSRYPLMLRCYLLFSYKFRYQTNFYGGWFGQGQAVGTPGYSLIALEYKLIRAIGWARNQLFSDLQNALHEGRDGPHKAPKA